MAVTVDVEHPRRGEWVVWEKNGDVYERFFRCRTKREVREATTLIHVQHDERERAGVWRS